MSVCSVVAAGELARDGRAQDGKLVTEVTEVGDVQIKANRSGLDDLVRVVNESDISSIAVPALGCGNGGLDWADVRPMIESAAARMPHVRAVVFALVGAPAASTMPNATPRPNLTVLRALLLLTIERYLERARLQEVREGASELEIQKLAYFLQVFGAPLRLNFVPGPYGPYADQLPHVLDALEGHYLTGLGDRSARVAELAPINVVLAAQDEASALLDADLANSDRLRTLLDVVE